MKEINSHILFQNTVTIKLTWRVHMTFGGGFPEAEHFIIRFSPTFTRSGFASGDIETVGCTKTQRRLFPNQFALIYPVLPKKNESWRGEGGGEVRAL